MATVACLNNSGNQISNSPVCGESDFLVGREKQSISASHLNGFLNHLADFIRRTEVLSDEWSLAQGMFQKFTSCWAMPEVDLFASSVNAKLTRFFSLRKWIVHGHWMPCRFRSRLCIFTPAHDSGGVKVSTGVSGFDVDCFVLKKETLVCSASVTDKSGSLDASESARLVVSRASFASSGIHAETGCLVSEKDILKGKGLAPKLVSTLLTSNKPVT